MTQDSIGVAVIGAGMAGRAHLAGYRNASSVFDPPLPPIRLVAVSDLNTELAQDGRARYGYERVEKDWRAIASADNIDVVSVVVANSLHREMVETLLAAGKHVLCEKPLAPSVEDAEAMVAAAESRPNQVATVGFVYRRQPAINAIRDRVSLDGSSPSGLGRPIHFAGSYWCDYAVDPNGPMSWRYQGGDGSGALADIGSHLIDTAEFLCGPIASVSGAVFSTSIAERFLPAGNVVGHGAAALSDVRQAVENEDVATFTARFASGAAATMSVSRATYGHANQLKFQLSGTHGAATFDMERPGEFGYADGSSPAGTTGYRQAVVGPEHPYIRHGLPMDFPSVNFGSNDLFTFQARAMLEQVAGIDNLPRCASMAEGLRNLRILAAVTRSAAAGGSAQDIN